MSIASAVCKNSAFNFQFTSICFGSLSPKYTYSFYNSIFQLTSQKNAHPPLSSQIKIASSKACQTGFEFITTQNSEKTSAFASAMDPDSRHVFLTQSQPYHFEFFLPLPQNMVVILRSKDIDLTRKFYEKYSTWTEEKHEKGPTHYSSQWGEIVAEIYPMRKLHSSSLELFIQVENIACIIDKLKKNHCFFFQQSLSHAVLQDPDGRLIQIMKIAY
jgi:hypothetical protein